MAVSTVSMNIAEISRNGIAWSAPVERFDHRRRRMRPEGDNGERSDEHRGSDTSKGKQSEVHDLPSGLAESALASGLAPAGWHPLKDPPG